MISYQNVFYNLLSRSLEERDNLPSSSIHLSMYFQNIYNMTRLISYDPWADFPLTKGAILNEWLMDIKDTCLRIRALSMLKSAETNVNFIAYLRKELDKKIKAYNELYETRYI